jgi:hypothetical protein
VAAASFQGTADPTEQGGDHGSKSVSAIQRPIGLLRKTKMRTTPGLSERQSAYQHRRTGKSSPHSRARGGSVPAASRLNRRDLRVLGGRPLTTPFDVHTRFDDANRVSMTHW